MSNKYSRALLQLVFSVFLSFPANSTTFFDLNSDNLLDFDEDVHDIQNLYEGNHFEFYNFQSQSYRNGKLIQVFDHFSDYELVLQDLENGQVIRILLKNGI